MEKRKNIFNVMAGVFFTLAIPAIINMSFYTTGPYKTWLDRNPDKYFHYLSAYLRDYWVEALIFAGFFLLLALGAFFRKSWICGISGFIAMLILINLPSAIGEVQKKFLPSLKDYSDVFFVIFLALLGLCLLLFGFIPRRKIIFAFSAVVFVGLVLFNLIDFSRRQLIGLNLSNLTPFYISASLFVILPFLGFVMLAIAAPVFDKPAPIVHETGGKGTAPTSLSEISSFGGSGSAPKNLNGSD